MADKRIQQYPEKVAPSTSDYLLVADAEDVDVNGYLKYKKVKISSLDNIVITNAEDITLTAINTLISTNALVIGRFYRITNSASGVNPILVQAVALNVLSDIGISSVNGTVYNYDISTDTVSVPYAGVYVPYTGATTNVDLGEYQIKVGQLELDQTPTGTFGVGKIRWNDTDGTPEVMLKGANVTLQIGQEQLARVVNKTNTNLTEAGYQVVRISGAQGQRLKVGLAQANSTSTCKDTLGLVTENISNNAEGFITTSGLVRNINTTGSLQSETWADGDRLYLSPSVAGGITNVEPSAPNIVIVLGYVVYAHANQGSIYVSVEGAKALHELFDVSIPTPTNNNVLVYESSTGLWKDKSISTILGFTPIANNATVGGELSGTLPNPSLVTSAVTGKALIGLSVSGSAVVSTDSILTGIGKLQNQINAVVGSVNFQGVWNASTNSPSLASGVGTKGYYYIVSVAGSTNLDGITDWKLGDWAIYDGTAWQKVDNTDAVVSVNGYTGIVTLAAADVGALPTSAISGTTGKLPKFTASGTIGDSIVSESGGTIGIKGILGDNAFIETTSNNGTIGTTSMLYGQNASGIGYLWNRANADIQIATNSTLRAVYTSDGKYITNSAADTGEAHIFGGSARVNGALTANGTLTVNEDGASTKIITIRSNWAGVDPAINVTTNNSLLLMTNNTERMRITSAGNVGIGTTSPSEKLTVNGNLKLTPSTSIIYGGDDVGLTAFSNSDLTTYISLYGSSGSHPTTPNVIRLHTSSTERMRITDGGNVGIGTTSPYQAKLDVSGINGVANIGASNSNLDQLLIGSIDRASAPAFFSLPNGSAFIGAIGNGVNNTLGIGTFGAAPLIFGTSNTEKMRITSSGNVLIGTTTDDGVNKLQVSGSVAISSTTGYQLISSGNTLFSLGYSGGTLLNRITGTSLFLAENGTPQLTIASGGAATFSSSVTATNGIFQGSTGETLTVQGITGEWAERITGSSSSGNSYGLLIAAGTNSSDFALNVFNQSISTSLFNIKGNGAATFSNGLTVKSTGYGTIASFLDAANSGIKLVANASVGYNEIISDGNQPFLITVNSAERFRIAGNGAATFSSKITAGSSTETLNAFSGSNNSLAQATIYGYNYNASGYSFYSGQGKVNFQSLPTSSAGLSAGDLWNNGGVVSIV